MGTSLLVRYSVDFREDASGGGVQCKPTFTAIAPLLPSASTAIMSLCHAVLSGDVNEVRAVLSKPEFNLSERIDQYNGGTAMHIAVIERQVEIFECLLNSPSALTLVDVGDGFNLRPLHYACSLPSGARSLILRRLLECERISLTSRGYNSVTPVHVAAYSGNDEAVELLLNHSDWAPSILKARRNLEKFSALHVAASKGHHKMVRLILESKKGTRKKRVEMLHAQKDRLGRRPLHYAAWENQVEAVKQLVVNCKSVDVNVMDIDGYTALHLASRRGNFAVVQMMLQHRKIDLDVITNSFQTVHEKVKLIEQKEETMRSAHSTEVEIALRELGSPKLKDFAFIDEAGGMTPLHCAVEQTHEEVVIKSLSSRKLKVSTANTRDESAFDMSVAAIIQNSQERSSLGRDLSDCAITAQKQMRILRGLFSKLHEHEETVYKEPNLSVCQDLVISSNVSKLLKRFLLVLLVDDILKHKVETTFETQTRNLRAPSGGVTLMRMIAYTGYDHNSLLKCVVSFPQVAEVINADDNDGRTPLHYAILAGQISSSQLLMDLPKMKLNKADKEGRSPVELALKTRHTDIQQMLLEKPAVREYVQHLYMDRQMYVDATNAILAGAGIIASITFPGWLDPPLEDNDENQLLHLPRSRSILQQKAFDKHIGKNAHVFEIFWVCNSMSFFFAVACALGGAGALLPSSHAFVRKLVVGLRGSVLLTSVLLTFAIVFVLGAFGAAGFAILPFVHMQTSTLVSCAFGDVSLFCGVSPFLDSVVHLVGNRRLVQMRRMQWPTASERNWRELLVSLLPGNSTSRSDPRAPLLPRVSRSDRFL